MELVYEPEPGNKKEQMVTKKGIRAIQQASVRHYKVSGKAFWRKEPLGWDLKDGKEISR